MSVKQTAFHDIHVKLGARMVEFAGFRMPLEYTGVTDEHVTVRTSVGVFDVSHMGEIWIRGSHALDLIQKITTNDASVLSSGKVQYSCMPNGRGGIVDDLLVHCFDGQTYLLVVNAANIEKDWNWIVQQNSMGAILENASDSISQLAVQGPKAVDILQELTPVPLSELKYYTFTIAEMAGVPGVIISATGYTGAGGFELYFPNAFAEKVWNAVFEAGKKAGIKPAGLAARDTLRLEMGYCLYGNDIDDTTSPIEAGLGWITKFTEGKNFIDRDLLWQQKQKGVARKLVGFEMIERGIPRQHYIIADASGNKVGEVTSGTMSPMLKKGIGMGYVKTELSAPGTEIFIIIRENPVKAVVVKPPFYKPQ